MSQALKALRSLRFDPTPTEDEVWTSLAEYHVDSLHPEVSRRLQDAMQTLQTNIRPPIVVLQGEPGAGKTHFVSWIREQIQAQGGYFFYVKLVIGQDFWDNGVASLVGSLQHQDDGGQLQLHTLLTHLSRKAGLDPETHAAVTGATEPTRAHLDAFVRGIRRLDRLVGSEASDTARALVLLASDGEGYETGNAYLTLTEPDPQDRAVWRMSAHRRPAQLVLRDLTRIFALAGPLVFAMDQIDNLPQTSERALDSNSSGWGKAAQRLSSTIGASLVALREEARRALMIVACHPATWDLIERTSMRTALDRVEVLPTLKPIPDAGTAAAILVRRLSSGYASIGFTPPYPTWPVTESALAEAAHRFTVRRLLLRVKEHAQECLDAGVAAELTTLAQHVTPGGNEARTTASRELADLFERLRAAADDAGPLDQGEEDRLMPPLLTAGLQSLVIELGGDQARFAVDTDFGRQAALHSRLRYILDEKTENEIHWSLRAIAADNAVAAQTRMRKAVLESGLTTGLPTRRLILIRNTEFPRSKKAQEIRDDFDARGGVSLPCTSADLRTLGALRSMLDRHPPGLTEWLRHTRPASGTELFATVVADLLDTAGFTVPPVPPSPQGTAPEEPRPALPDIVLGTTVRGSNAFTVTPSQLLKHTVMIGASGSGKTVLIKRLIEQCALRGVSAIVVDPNDDLARLGDPWPSPPKEWTEEHDGEAERYFAGTEVRVWTPGLQRGRPLSFPPVPDFGPVLGEADDFARLLASTVATLAPQARIRGDSARATQQLGVLRRALDQYVRGGGRTMDGLLDLLAEPSSDIVNSRTRKLAVEMADTLQAATEHDPLFAENGTPTDPGMLLTPTSGRSARISVISLGGLTRESQARFVSRLQGELFSWFKAHPTRGDQLGGLLVMDEAGNFVPSGGSRSSTASTVELIRQIRKYGLGVVLGTQAPKGIHHEAIGNTANQFLGALRVPAQIEAAREMAQARSSSVDDIGALGPGTFYAAGDGTGFRKIQAPICLTHHAEPLTEEEIIERSHRDG